MSFPRQPSPSLVTHEPGRFHKQRARPELLRGSLEQRKPTTMSRPTSSRTVPAILAAIVLLSALAVGATAVFGRTVTPAP